MYNVGFKGVNGLNFKAENKEAKEVKDNAQPKIQQPLAGLIAPPTPPKRPDKNPMIPPPLAGAIAYPTPKNPTKIPYPIPPLGGLIAPPSKKDGDRVMPPLSGNILPPTPEKQDENPDDKKVDDRKDK